MQVLQQVLARLDGIGARLDGIDARLDGVDARLDNVRRRAHNLRTLSSGQALQPLRRELQQAAAGGAAAGDLPPDGAFPADRLALQSVGAGATAAAEQAMLGSMPGPFAKLTPRASSPFPPPPPLPHSSPPRRWTCSRAFMASPLRALPVGGRSVMTAVPMGGPGMHVPAVAQGCWAGSGSPAALHVRARRCSGRAARGVHGLRDHVGPAG